MSGDGTLTTVAWADEAALIASVDARLRIAVNERGLPAELGDAVLYALLGPGKRVRPVLVVRGYEALAGTSPERALQTPGLACVLTVAAALEMIHAFSLIHDDLPAMDDDDLRRGRPTVHRAFDEATAILAGDALLTLAFEVLADPATHPDGAVRAALVAELAKVAGAAGMVEGQMRDLTAEGRFSDDGRPLALGEADVLALQGLKTGALFRFAATAGAILGGASEDDRIRLSRYGAALGRAFQIADDLLDEEADSAAMGKATGKDRDAGKATLPVAIGAEAARARLGAALGEARDLLTVFGSRADALTAAADFAGNRSS